MRRTIWKYGLPGERVVDVGVYLQRGPIFTSMPAGAEIVSVGFDLDGDPSLWVMVDPTPSAEKKIKEIIVAWTGDFLDGALKVRYIGRIESAGLIYHVLEVL